MKVSVDIKKLNTLIDLMEARDLAEIEIRQDDDSIRVVRRQPGHVTVTPGLENSGIPVPPATPSVPQPPNTPAPAEQGDIITAPMVGTFYQASSPDSPAFVSVGSQVKAGDSLCIIESMKMMNHVKADKAGRIEAILVGNGDAVAFDQPLFRLV